MKKISQGQSVDEVCCKVKNELLIEGCKERYKKWFTIHQGLLFRRGSGRRPGYKLVIPRAHVIDLVNQEHLANGHFGVKKCLAFLQRYYYFPKMEKLVRRIIAGCEICQRSKVGRKCHGLMQNILPPPNELVATDLLGPLPKSRGGVEYLLVFVDCFSKLVVCAPIKKATSRAIIRVLTERFIPYAGKPKAILSDNGTQYSSVVWLSTLENLGIKAVHTSYYFPQGNPTERVNREIVRLLRTFCSEKHTKWSYFMDDIEFWLNNAVHDSTGYTANEIHFAQPRRNDFLKEINFPDGSGLQSEDHNAVIMLARERLQSKAAMRTNKHNLRYKPVKFNPGDRVWVKSHEKSSAIDKTINSLTCSEVHTI